MIILGVTTGTSIGKLYLGGFIPGSFTGLCLMALAWVYAKRMNLPPGDPFSLRKVGASFRQASCRCSHRSSSSAASSPASSPPPRRPRRPRPTPSSWPLRLPTLTLRQLPLIFLRVAERRASSSSSSRPPPLRLDPGAEQIPRRWPSSSSHHQGLLRPAGPDQRPAPDPGHLHGDIAIIIIVVPVLMPLVTSLGMDPVHFGVMVTVNMPLAPTPRPWA